MQESGLNCGTPLNYHFTVKLIYLYQRKSPDTGNKRIMVLYSLNAASFHLFTGITGTLTATEDYTLYAFTWPGWFHVVASGVYQKSYSYDYVYKYLMNMKLVVMKMLWTL